MVNGPTKDGVEKVEPLLLSQQNAVQLYKIAWFLFRRVLFLSQTQSTKEPVCFIFSNIKTRFIVCRAKEFFVV